ncbi:protein FAM98A-like [Protopterus annectens]|uniref:protein FAM98A-like n=1 Tax=Protopterus annectens TaxID=7888 RepID=UPI001CF95431|nr:protein FAM98A-like [Protopterus annectens]
MEMMNFVINASNIKCYAYKFIEQFNVLTAEFEYLLSDSTSNVRTFAFKKPLRDMKPLSDKVHLTQAADVGASSPEFTSLCAWLVSNIKAVCLLEEVISPTSGPDDAETFQLEVSGVVSELQCPYQSLTSGSVTDRLTTNENCLLLLLFLCSELQAARLLFTRHQPSSVKVEEKNETLEELKLICETLALPEPELDVSVSQLLTDVHSKISECRSLLPDNRLLKPLLNKPLQPDQWEKLAWIHWTLRSEYECRMKMLLSRVDVTVKSFHWSDRAKKQTNHMVETFEPLRRTLSSESHVTLAHLLAAREDVASVFNAISKTSEEKNICAVKKVMMGSVPDRGGRPTEIEPPMPEWQHRREGTGKRGNKQWSKKKK